MQSLDAGSGWRFRHDRRAPGVQALAVVPDGPRAPLYFALTLTLPAPLLTVISTRLAALS